MYLYWSYLPMEWLVSVSLKSWIETHETDHGHPSHNMHYHVVILLTDSVLVCSRHCSKTCNHCKVIKIQSWLLKLTIQWKHFKGMALIHHEICVTTSVTLWNVHGFLYDLGVYIVAGVKQELKAKSSVAPGRGSGWRKNDLVALYLHPSQGSHKYLPTFHKW